MAHIRLASFVYFGFVLALQFRLDEISKASKMNLQAASERRCFTCRGNIPEW